MGRRCSHRLLLLAAAVLVLLLSAGREVGADELTLPGYVILWSPQGPVAVDRETEITASELGIVWAEELLAALLEGPTEEEAELGLHTAIPQGTTMAEVLEAPEGTLIIRLEMPLDALPDLNHDSFEIIVNQLGTTLRPLDWRDLRIKIRGPEGTFVPLADFLPEVVVPRKEPVPGLPEPLALEAQQAPLPGQGQPTGALSGKNVYVSAGHGWWWRHDRWRTQRPPYPNHPSYPGPIIEDHKTAEAVNQYLIQYLWNAGATVWPTRERGMNPAEMIVVNDALAPGTGYTETGHWVTTSETGTGYRGTSYRWAETVNAPPTATATWRATVPADGRYPVYVWYRPGTNRPQQAQYLIHHAGGESTVHLDQRTHGNTWHYLGTYGFLAGQEATVTLTNQSSDAGKAVIADSVRFGGGTFDDLGGIVTGASHAPNKPWWEMGSYYYTQNLGMPPANNDIVARPVYARWEHWGTGDDAVFVSWHTNGWSGWNETIRGTETYAHNGLGKPRTEGSLELRNAIHSQLVHDIRVGWDPHWVDRGAKLANLGELRELWDPNPSARMPGALIEVAFHDHPQDADALKDPQFNMLAARAVYKGIVGYFEQRDGVALPVLPEPPTGLRVQNAGDGAVRVAWEPSPTDSQGLLGDPPTGYRVYTSPNGIGWSDGQLVTGGTSVTLSGLPEGELIYVRVTAINQGGESFATETLAARVGDLVPVLIVNGFTRLDNTSLVGDHDPVEGYNERMLLDQMNRYDYVIQHAEVIPYPFDSAGNGAVKDGLISLDGYQLVVWILGQESYRDGAMSKSEQALLREHLDGGGALFISGSEIAWTLDNLGDADDRDFFRQYLRAAFVGNGTDTWQVAPVSGSIFDGLGSFRFDTPGMYLPRHPDQVGVSAGSTEALRYEGGRGGTAAIQYADGCERVVTFGFPFETIRPESRAAVMERVLDYLGACLYLPPQVTITTPTDGSAHNRVPAFEVSVQDHGRGLAGVEVQIQRLHDGLIWTGEDWGSDSERWLEANKAEEAARWFYHLPDMGRMADGNYTLRARARAADATLSADAAKVEIIVDTQPPPTPAGLIRPVEEVELKALRVELHWETVDQDGGSRIGYQVEVNGHIHAAPDSPHAVWLRGSGPHEWRVQAVDQAGNESGWTSKATFYLDQSHLMDLWLPIILREFDR